MILSDKKILEEIKKGNIKIEPFDIRKMGSNSYDVHLSKHLAQYVDKALDAKKHNKVIINTANLTTFNMTNVLMHEISHPVGSLDHVDTSQAPCGPLDSDPRVLSNRNLMCGASRWAGRLLTPAQCTAIYSNTNVNVKIANLNQ